MQQEHHALAFLYYTPIYIYIERNYVHMYSTFMKFDFVSGNSHTKSRPYNVLQCTSTNALSADCFAVPLRIHYTNRKPIFIMIEVYDTLKCSAHALHFYTYIFYTYARRRRMFIYNNEIDCDISIVFSFLTMQ